MKKIEVDKDLLYKYYIEENLSIQQTADKMRIGARTIQRHIDKNNFHKTTEQIKKQREALMLEKYGVTNIYQDKEIIKKIRAKSKETLLKKYGVTHNFQLESSKNNIRKKKKENYFAHPEIIENKYTLLEWIAKFKEENNRKPTYIDLQSYLECAYTTVCAIVDKYKVKSEFKILHSYLEFTVEEFIKTLNIRYIKHNRKEIKPLELDFYFPENRVAIEVNDIASHNSTQSFIRGNIPIDKNYHTNKSKLCEDRGIRLIHIWEYEWNNERQRPILENIIKNALGINEHKIYARKLDIEVRESKSMREFFDTNNIQGFRPGKFTICLVDKNTKEVYMSYMIGSCFFGKGKYDWEVIRGATKLGYTVVGGASKIWKYFIDNYNPKNCVYYIDYNYFNGNSLPHLGLNYITTQYSYKNWWVETQEIKNREPMKHKEIKEKYKTGEVLQIYNAGTKVYLYEVSD